MKRAFRADKSQSVSLIIFYTRMKVIKLLRLLNQNYLYPKSHIEHLLDGYKYILSELQRHLFTHSFDAVEGLYCCDYITYIFDK